MPGVRLTRRSVPALGVAALAILGGAILSGAKLMQKPKTVIQVVTIKWTMDAAPEQRKAALDGVEKMAAEIPGVRNIWLRATRVQPREFMSAFAMEFEDLPSAERFVHTPAYELWNKSYLPIIEESRTQQVTN